MNPRYSALLQLVDYPMRAEHVAIGDLLCIDGRWRAVTQVTDYAIFECKNDDGFPQYHSPGGVTPRIPGPLLALLEAAKDPYR